MAAATRTAKRAKLKSASASARRANRSVPLRTTVLRSLPPRPRHQTQSVRSPSQRLGPPPTPRPPRRPLQRPLPPTKSSWSSPGGLRPSARVPLRRQTLFVTLCEPEESTRIAYAAAGTPPLATGALVRRQSPHLPPHRPHRRSCRTTLHPPHHPPRSSPRVVCSRPPRSFHRTRRRRCPVRWHPHRCSLKSTAARTAARSFRPVRPRSGIR